MKRLIGNIVVLAIAIWIGLFIYGFVHEAWSDSRNLPGKKQFETVDGKILVYSGTVAFGNSEPARQLAANFGSQLKALNDALFTGGSKLTPATGGHFLVYCHLDDSAAVFLCQVPDLRGYRAQVRDALAKVAWGTARGCVGAKHLGSTLKLAVGLRGFGSYGPIMEGDVTGLPSASIMDDPDAVSRLYPYFLHD